jgi:hypothetical protein
VRVIGSQRRLLVLLAAVAAVVAGAQAWTGVMELAVYFAPLLLVAGLLLSGRFVGEEKVVARVRAAMSAVARRAPRALPRPVAVRALVSSLARSVRVERGPPAAFAPAA